MRDMDTVVLDCDKLVRKFGDLTAVADVSFSITAGETYGLLGPNGAGKTTTISMVCGLLRATSGSVRVLGQTITPTTTSAKAAIGLVPQDVALYPDLSARENLNFFGRLQGLSGSVLKDRIDLVLEVVGLQTRAKDRIETYSGGMKRRANIAVGLLHEPSLLVLDEPTVGVDPQSRNAILQAVAELGASGMAILYTTHYMEEAERLCDRVGIIDEGQLIAEGSPADLVAGLSQATMVVIRTEANPGSLQSWKATVAQATGVQSVRLDDDGATITCTEPAAAVAGAFAAAEAEQLPISGVEITEPDLEAVFLSLTGKALRDHS